MAYIDEVLADSPVLLLPFDDSSSPAQDATANNHDAAQTGGVTFQADGPIPGRDAISLDGTDDYLEVTDAAGIDLGNGPFTLETLLRRGRSGAITETILDKGDTSFVVYFDSDTLYVDKSYTASSTIVNSSVTITDTQWHHIVVTRTNSTTDNKIWIDGIDRTTAGSNQTLASTAHNLRIGNMGGSAPVSEFFQGGLAMTAVYGAVLSDSRIAAHCKAFSRRTVMMV